MGGVGDEAAVRVASKPTKVIEKGKSSQTIICEEQEASECRCRFIRLFG